MGSETSIELRGPLPGDDLSAVLTWMASRAGPLPDREAPREEATHAVLATRGLGDRNTERRLTLAEADAYLAEVAALRERHAALDRRSAERREERVRQRDERAQTIDLDCPHCHRPRRYDGRLDLLAAERPEHVAREDQAQLARPRTVALHAYVCPDCGSAELFSAGVLDHPLPGAASDP